MFSLDSVVPWGRSYKEYLAMFALTMADCERRILGCGDGPAAFNAMLTEKGGQVVSVDPLYCFSEDDIQARIEETCAEVMSQTRDNQDEFVWTHIPSPADLEQLRLSAMQVFLSDYPQGLAQGRYRPGSLPELDFPDNTFDLALCSHLLFLYSGLFSEVFHLQSIKELRRVAGEVRIFPLVELGSKQSRHLEAVVDRLKTDGYNVTLTPVAYEFQRGGNYMMVVQ